MRYAVLPWILALVLAAGCSTDATEDEDGGGSGSPEDSGADDADVLDASDDAWVEFDASDLGDATLDVDASEFDATIDDASTEVDASGFDATIDDGSVPSDAGDDVDAGESTDASIVDAGDVVDSGFDAGFDAGVDAGRDSGVGSVCGNGIVEPGEQCDGDTGCCTRSCRFDMANAVCGPALDECHTIRRCSAQGVCRMSRPKMDGVACMVAPGEAGRCMDGVCE